MMKTYEIKLNNLSNTLTSFQSDTLFGHLCWVVANKEGESELKKFIAPFINNEPPFVISDGFPSSLFPKPLSAEFLVEDPLERKELKKVDFIDLEKFELLSKGNRCTPVLAPTPLPSHLTIHNTISRLTNSTVEGGLYSQKEVSVPKVSIYVKTISPDWKDRVLELFQMLSKGGYGKKKSVGKGHFKVEEVKEFYLKSADAPSGFVSFSNFCPAEHDPTEGLYKTFVKYGKLGDGFTFCGNPFKRPLVMIRTGSVFKTDGTPKEYYGRMVHEGIAPAKPEVVQYGYAFAVPIVYPI